MTTSCSTPVAKTASGRLPIEAHEHLGMLLNAAKQYGCKCQPFRNNLINITGELDNWLNAEYTCHIELPSERFRHVYYPCGSLKVIAPNNFATIPSRRGCNYDSSDRPFEPILAISYLMAVRCILDMQYENNKRFQYVVRAIDRSVNSLKFRLNCD